MSSLKLRELAASYRSYGSELSLRARHATCIAWTILSVSDSVGRLNRKSRGLEDADWLMRPVCLLAAACALANSDCCSGDQLLLRAGSFIMSGIITPWPLMWSVKLKCTAGFATDDETKGYDKSAYRWLNSVLHNRSQTCTKDDVGSIDNLLPDLNNRHCVLSSKRPQM